MSQTPGSTPPNPDGSSPAPAANPAMVRRRPASVQLRGGEESAQSLMDPANQSLADALKITYRLIQLAMVALVIAYIASGFQTVKLTETGIRVTLGEADVEPLQPGFVFSLPTPLGEVVKIDTSKQTESIDERFFPRMSSEDRRKPSHELVATNQRASLKPLIDNYHLTGDLNIAHSRWKLEYEVDRNQVLDFARTVKPESIRDFVITAVARGVVQAVGAVSIDELLKGQPDPNRKGPMPVIEEEARRIAQATLDEMKSGIVISKLVVESRDPPFYLFSDFSKVDTNKQEARAKLNEAQQIRQTKLTQTAGSAAPIILKLIDRFDKATASKNTAEADAILAQLHDIFEGKAVKVDGEEVPRISGEAATTITSAMQYRASIAAQAKADAEVFKGKLGVYRTNPSMLITGEWTEAYKEFVKKQTTLTTWWVPRNGMLEVWMNPDPTVMKEIERLKMQNLNRRSSEQGLKDLDNAKYNQLITPTNTVTSQ